MGDAQTTAGLPRRYAPRNDKGGSGGRGGFGSGFRAYHLCCHCEPGRAWQSGLLTFMSLRGRSRRELTWQSSLRRDAGCRGDAQTVAGLPRRGFAPSRNDNGGKPTTLGLRLLGLARLRYWLAGRRLRRKPWMGSPKSGGNPSRVADRVKSAGASKAPPRETRREPVAGPIGSVTEPGR